MANVGEAAIPILSKVDVRDHRKATNIIMTLPLLSPSCCKLLTAPDCKHTSTLCHNWTLCHNYIPTTDMQPTVEYSQEQLRAWLMSTYARTRLIVVGVVCACLSTAVNHTSMAVDANTCIPDNTVTMSCKEAHHNTSKALFSKTVLFFNQQQLRAHF